MQKLSFVIFAGIISHASIAQRFEEDDSLFTPSAEQFEYITENLDFTEAATGYLFDKGLPMLDFDTYYGNTLTELNISNSLSFAFGYASLSSMALNDVSLLAHPDSSYGNVLRAHNNADEVLIGGLHFEYNRLATDAIENNLITSNGEQLFDVSGRPYSPYELHEFFLTTPMKLSHNGLLANFKLSSDLFFENKAAVINVIKADFGDGLGLRIVNFDSPLAVAYDSAGTKTIVIEIEYAGGGIYRSHSDITITNQARYANFDDPDMTEFIEASEAYEGEDGSFFGSAQVSVYFGCGHDKLVKPLIWVEGFNPIVLTEMFPFQNLDPKYMFDIISDGLGQFDFTLMRNHFDEEGYDLVYVDFTDGGDYIQRNAFVVQEVIRWVNEQKAENGSTEKNVVIGESMGGLVARYALRDMELDDEDHETETYVSLDSPHNGANIPVGAQYAARHVPHIKIWTPTIASGGTLPPLELYQFVHAMILVVAAIDTTVAPEALALDLRIGEWMLDAPAAQQMLIYQARKNFLDQPGANLVNELHEDFMEEYQTMGPPVQCEVLMSSNGSNKGPAGNQGFAPGANLLLAKSGLVAFLTNTLGGMNLPVTTTIALDYVSLIFLGSAAYTDFRINALPNYSSEKELVYKGKIISAVLGVPLTWTNKSVKVKEVYPIDGAPGGYPTINSLPDIALVNNSVASGALDVNFAKFNYVPTYSSLDLGYSNIADPFIDLTNLISTDLASPAFRTTANNSLYQDDDLLGDPVFLENSYHIHLYPRNAHWLHFHLVGDNTINQSSVLSSGSYNFGIGLLSDSENFENTMARRTTARITNLNFIEGTAQVYINIPNRVGLIADGNPFIGIGTTTSPTNFDVFVKGFTDPECDAYGNTLTVRNGGLFSIGEGEFQTGTVHILDGTELVIANGGDVYVRENSKIVVYDGGKLIIEDGGQLFNFGKIHLCKGGILEYQDGAQIKMTNSESQIHLDGGKIQVGPNATFTLDHTGSGESGWINVTACCDENVIADGPDSRFLLTGKNETDVILGIGEGADFWTSDDLQWTKIDDGRVNFAHDARLVSESDYFSHDLRYWGGTTDRGMVLYDHSTLNDCTFEDVEIDAPLFYLGTGSLNVLNSTFNKPFGDFVIRVAGNHYNITGCTFNTDALTVIRSSNLNLYSQVANSIFNCNIGYSGIVSTAVYDHSYGQISVRNNTFNDCYAGILKGNGKLDARCNTFNNFLYTGIEASNGCYLQMGSTLNQGYNIFVKSSPGTGHNIGLYNAQYMQIKDGYNTFDDKGSLPIIEGSVQIGFPSVAKQYMQAHKNVWNISSPSTLPPSSRFDITSSITGLDISLAVVDPQNATCGTFDPAGGIFTTGLDDLGGSKKVTTPHFDDIKIIDAVDQTLKYLETEDSVNGNDLFAIELFGEILTDDIQSPNKATDWLLAMSAEYMSNALQSAFTNGQITRSGNRLSFDQYVQRYVDALNYQTAADVTANNYQRLFYLEMEKAHLFHLLGDYSLAIQILENAELCGLDFTEQQHLNEWKFRYTEEFRKFLFGVEAQNLDTNWVDTSNYIRPIQQAFGEFGSFIVDRQSVNFFNCSQPKAPIRDEGISIDIYPNPSNGVFNVRWSYEDISSATFRITGIDGKANHFQNLLSNEIQTVDLSHLSHGVYIYSLEADGAKRKSGKIVIH